MSFWSTVSGLVRDGWTESSETRTFTYIPSAKTDKTGGRQPADAEAYVQLYVTRAHLKNAREGWKTYAPVVQTTVSMVAPGGDREIPFVVGTTRFKDVARRDALFFENVAVTPPVPYLGGNLKLLAGVIGVARNDYAKALVGLLGSMSEAIGGQALSTALGVINPLKTGVEGLLGLSDKQLKVGIETELSPDTSADGSFLQSGYFAIVDFPESPQFLESLHVKDGKLMEGSREVSEDYLLMRLAVLEKLGKEEWRKFATLETLAAEVRKAAIEGRNFQPALRAFKIAVLASGDLIHSDQVRIYKGVESSAKRLAGDGAPRRAKRRRTTKPVSGKNLSASIGLAPAPDRARDMSIG
jgi:hypothetical protein